MRPGILVVRADTVKGAPPDAHVRSAGASLMREIYGAAADRRAAIPANCHGVSSIQYLGLDVRQSQGPAPAERSEPVCAAERAAAGCPQGGTNHCAYTPFKPVTQQARQLGPVHVQHKLAVLAHQAVGQHLGVAAVHRLGNQGQQCMSIPVVNKGQFAPVASRSNVVDRSGGFDSQ